MTNIHFLEMIHQFDDIIQTHVLLQLQEETDVASRLILISYLEMEMPSTFPSVPTPTIMVTVPLKPEGMTSTA